MRKPISREIFIIQQVAILMLFSVFLVHATPTSNFSQNKTDQTRRSSARIDPVTLGLNIEIPLGSYPGRGGADIPLTISYSSKVWTSDVHPGFRSPCWDYERPCLNGINRPDRTIAVFGNNSMAGWTSSLKVPKVVYTGKFQAFMLDGSPSCQECYEQVRIQRIHVYLPDGSTHELRKSDTATDLSSDWSGAYYAVDGSQMRYETEIKTLFMPDGSRYIIHGALLGNDNSLVGNSLAQNIYDNYYLTQSAEYIDRNGNKSTYNPTTKKWTDTLGREFGSPFPADVMDPPGHKHTPNNATEGDIVYLLPGMGTGTIQYTFKWKKLSDAFSNSSYQVHYAGNQTGNVGSSPVSPALFQYTGALGLFNPVVLAEIVLPDNTSYKFGYNPYAEIDKLTHPTGAYEKFTYSPIIPMNWQIGYSSTYEITELNLNRGVTEYSISAKGDGSDEIITNYAAGYNNPYDPTQLPYKTTISNPDGTVTERLIHTEDSYHLKYGFDTVPSGKVYEERLKRGSTMLRRTLTDWNLSGPQSGGLSMATRNPRVVRQTEILFEGTDALAKSTVFQQDEYQNLISTAEYDFLSLNYTTAQTAEIGQISLGTLLRKSETDYKTDSTLDIAYLSRQIVNLPKESRIRNASGQVVSRVQIFYDETINYPLVTYSTMPTNWQNPNTNIRGNATTTRSYYNLVSNLYIETNAQYDQFGNPHKIWDGRGNYVETQYTDNYTDNTDRYSYALPTKTISYSGANGTGNIFESYIKYDFKTGLPRYTTNSNNQTSEIQYNDALLRPTKMIAPNGHQTITEYGVPNSSGQLSAEQRFVKTSSQINTQSWREGYVWFDGLGRSIKSQIVDSAGDVFTLTCYDVFGRLLKVSNPFRNISNATCASSLEWTMTTYDATGRAWKVTTPDNAVIETSYALATSGNHIGKVVIVKDQALKERRSIMNALGQLVRVDESTDIGGLGTINAPNQPTYYEYDTLSNLTAVKQGGTFSNPEQTRTFQYDSLSRLKSATNPESGTTTYAYDENGNLTSKIDARNIITSYAFDALNRVTSKNYSDNVTLPVTYTYDDKTNAKGRLTKIVTGTLPNVFSTTEYQSFDLMGRVTQSQQTTDGILIDPMTYVYNLSGLLIEQTYPSGRVVKNVLDTDGDLMIVQSKKNANYGYWNYAKSFTYTAAGDISSMQLGNGHWESTQFNSRLQPTQIALGGTQNTTNILKLNFDYGIANNNGNLLSQTITVPNETRNSMTYNAFTATQNYTYDSLNRLKTAEETIPSQTGWKQTFKYDRYGNRQFDYGVNPANPDTTTPNGQSTLPKVVNPEVLSSNNRFKQDQDNDSLPDYLYDSAGNTTKDANNKKFTYDAENKQTKVETVDTNGNVASILGKYFYDGDGKRVKKMSATETTVFIYNVVGELVAEYANQTSTIPKVSYLTSDHIGSPRINTDQNGIVISRHDYQPFGEEIYSISGNTARTGYNTDEIRKQFTSYERDNETDLDYANARMYASKLGRFTTTDPIFLGLSRSTDPQRFNQYVYVRNNPFKYIDTNGKDLKLVSGLKQPDQDRIIKNLVKIYRKESGRTAINQLAKSDMKYVFGTGDLKSKADLMRGGYLDQYGRTAETKPIQGKVDKETKKISAITTPKTDITIGVTLDFQSRDDAQRAYDNRLQSNEPQSEKDVFAHEVGHSLDKDNDLLKEMNQTDAEAEKTAEDFVKKLNDEKNSMSEEDAEEKVREIVGIPKEEKKKDKSKEKKKDKDKSNK